MKTLEQIQEWFGVGDETARQLYELQEIGMRHGMNGWYQDGDFSSDADWCYGVGARIQHLETLLSVDDCDVFDLYADAHAEFLVRDDENSFNR